MLDILRSISRPVFLFGIAVLLAVMPFSKYVISVSQFIIAGAWLAGRMDFDWLTSRFFSTGRLRAALMLLPWILWQMLLTLLRGIVDLWRNRPAFIFASLLLLHVAGMAYTSDFGSGLKDIRIKVPLFLLPLLLATSEPIGKRGFRNFLLIFILALTVGTIINTVKISYYQYADVREVARHVSHIILGLQIALSLFLILFLVFRDAQLHRLWKALLTVIFFWQLFYLFYTQSFTGIAVFFITLPLQFLIILFRRRSLLLRASLAAVIILITGGVAIYLTGVIRDFNYRKPVDFSRLEPLSPRGNPYTHNPRSTEYENGNPVWIYIQMEEMREEWNKRSPYQYDSLNKKGEIVAFTLIRFLASKELRRDAGGVQALSEEEVQAIERGIPNVIGLHPWSIRSRIYELLWGYKHYRETGDPSGLTLMQRFEYWKASFGIIARSPWFGVGTGDVEKAFDRQYVQMQTKLEPDKRWRSHNQFLSILVAFGVTGLVWFLIALFWPPIRMGFLKDYFFVTFLIIGLLAMMVENTLETQTGVTFFTFFYCFFLFFRRDIEPV